MELSKIGVWFGTLGNDPTNWSGVILCKLEFTPRSFRKRLLEIVCELRNVWFPMEELKIELKYCLVEMQPDMPRDWKWSNQ